MIDLDLKNLKFNANRPEAMLVPDKINNFNNLMTYTEHFLDKMYIRITGNFLLIIDIKIGIKFKKITLA
jgi:hypothetical protein